MARLRRITLALTLVAGLASTAYSQTPYNFTTFSDPPPNWGADQATRINRYHTVVGTTMNSGGTERGFVRYNDGTWKTYVAPNAVDTRFFDRNDTGTVAGAWFDGARVHGLVFYNGSFQTVDYPNAYHTQLLSINNAGVILGSFVFADGSSGSFLLNNGQFSSISCTNLPGRVIPRYLDSRGVMVGDYIPTNGDATSGVIIRQGSCESIQHPKAGTATHLRAINKYDVAVGSYDDLNYQPHAFRYANGVFEDLQVPNSTSSTAEGIDQWGEITGLAMTRDAFVTYLAAPIPCSANQMRTVVICSPKNGSTTSSPVQIVASAKAGASHIQRMEVWLDSKKKWEVANSPFLDVSLMMAAGPHRIAVQAVDNAGTFKAAVNVTIQ